MLELKKVQSGETVSNFLEKINDNFDAVNTNKQQKIYIMTSGATQDAIEIDASGTPSGGSNGDIVIVYEE